MTYSQYTIRDCTTPLISTPDDRRWSGAAKLIMGGVIGFSTLIAACAGLWSIHG